jgi:hypothetical protein
VIDDDLDVRSIVAGTLGETGRLVHTRAEIVVPEVAGIAPNVLLLVQSVVTDGRCCAPLEALRPRRRPASAREVKRASG